MGFLSQPVASLTDFQMEFGGMLMGPGTDYDFQPGLDWLDLGAVKTVDTPRDYADGSRSGPDYADVKILTADIEIWGDSPAEFQAACLAYINRFTVQADDIAFWQKIPGFPVLGIGAKVTKRTLPITLGVDLGNLAVGSVQLRAVNPVWQSLARTVLLASSASLTAGLVAPLGATAAGGVGVLDAGLASSVSFSAALANAGNTAAWPSVTVSGPCPGGFTITVDGNAVTYGLDVLAGQTVTVDYLLGTATLGDGADRTYGLTARSFSPVQPGGASTVAFIAASGSAAVTTADMWR